MTHHNYFYLREVFEHTSWYLDSVAQIPKLTTKSYAPPKLHTKQTVQILNKQEIRSSVNEATPSPPIKQTNSLVFVYGLKSNSSSQDQAQYEEAKELLLKMLKAMKLSSSEYKLINENPEQEIQEHRPDYVLCLGAQSFFSLTNNKERLVSVHGRPFRYKENFPTKVVPIFHPTYLLINPRMKQIVWQDLQRIMKSLGKIK